MLLVSMDTQVVGPHGAGRVPGLVWEWRIGAAGEESLGKSRKYLACMWRGVGAPRPWSPSMLDRELAVAGNASA